MKNLNFIFSKKIILLGILFAAHSLVFCQTVQEFNEQMVLLEGSSDPILILESARLNNLVKDVQPTLYCKSTGILENTDIATPPLRVVSNSSTIIQLYDNIPIYNSVELICIKVESLADLNTVIDIAGLTGFTNLKYIYFLCSVKICPELMDDISCEKNKIIAMIQNYGTPGLRIIYKSTINE